MAAISSRAVLRVRDLRRSFGDLVAVGGVSFEIAPGECFGLLGPNGAGKTTTIHMIIGAIAPDAGRVEIDGETDSARPNVRRRLGFAPQALAIYETLTAEENLAFFARLYGLAGAALRERVAWALELAGLTDRRAELVKRFSGGMKRRLNLVCALVHGPKVVLLDEPTAGVDPQSRNHLFENIEALRREGLTVLYTTHYMEEAQRLCDRVAIMDHGRVLDIGAVEELIARHGGRSVIEAELERPPTAEEQVPGALDGTRVRLETERPLEDAARLMGAGVPVASLSIHRPDLETVFLALTGRRLRD